MELIKRIVEHILGRKYYANIVRNNGTNGRELASFIFRTKTAAEEHRNILTTNRLYTYVETISFRSHREYETYRPFEQPFKEK